ncbi:hypothetical protein Corgl_1597 [Coriobacterium glomerans PW2]|uniref:Uncharacterized protein n=1 Tax=Coriobacterium glomerans (strain ATCC 49209 / DSM 20642 / JCM 10262 / PW2) TaxID=700015 RepID=F2N920_CORGP|nr:hypothetical protein Corgl_1597 [Coriobacterium glomerans PW2]
MNADLLVSGICSLCWCGRLVDGFNEFASRYENEVGYVLVKRALRNHSGVYAGPVTAGFDFADV